jgi:hypothetical protein
LWQHKPEADAALLVTNNHRKCSRDLLLRASLTMVLVSRLACYAAWLKSIAVLLSWPASSAAGDDSLVRTGDGRLPADSLVLSTRNIWGIIKSQKDLNLPAHKVRRSSGARFCGCGMLLLLPCVNTECWHAMPPAACSYKRVFM